ncbi:MAG: metalloregulator ArsR/SmtB family transcription factor [Desulfatibacillum sp.]|nr:metalloregulator ArsR/SmtB family transcription factor [Desulfatibacillum sp.]
MEIHHSVTLLKALADESRLKIIQSLFTNAQYVEEIAQRLNLAVSTVSHHLKKLEAAGLVEKKKEQYYVMYRVREEKFEATLKSLVCFQNLESQTQEARIRNYRKRVLDVFFRNGRLERMPSQHKKRLIVLYEIAKRFHKGTEYTEQEVNALIEPAFSDYCTIRREMIDTGIMERQDGVYRLADANESAQQSHDRPNQRKKEKAMDRRKALKQEYLETFTAPGICKITNKVNGKIFLAGSLNVEALARRHRSELKLGSHRNEELLYDYRELGDENFSFEVLESVEQHKDPAYDYAKDVAVLLDLWLEKLQPYGDKGYNRAPKTKTG